MAPEEIKKARQGLGMTQRALATTLRMGPNGGRTVRRWEDGQLLISGPASVALEALLSGWRPSQLPESIGG